MTTLTPGKVLSSRTSDVTVENRLTVGKWRFQLTVLDDDRNESAPAMLVVNVIDPRTPPTPTPTPVRGGPTPVLTPVRVPGTPVRPGRPQ